MSTSGIDLQRSGVAIDLDRHDKNVQGVVIVIPFLVNKKKRERTTFITFVIETRRRLICRVSNGRNREPDDAQKTDQ